MRVCKKGTLLFLGYIIRWYDKKKWGIKTMNISQDILDKALQEIEQLGYETRLECTNPKRSWQVQQLHVYKEGKCIARVSLMLACRIDTMKNGVGRNELPLFKILCNLSAQV